jgi:streptogramin lyase
LEEPAPGGIISGPDGNLWFGVGSNVDRLTTSGVITQFDVGGYVKGLAASPDGNIWFTAADLTQNDHPLVGRLTVVH